MCWQQPPPCACVTVACLSGTADICASLEHENVVCSMSWLVTTCSRNTLWLCHVRHCDTAQQHWLAYCLLCSSMLCVCLLLVIRWRGDIAKVPSMPGARWESRVQSDAWVYCIQSEQLAPLYFRTSPSEQPTLLLPAAAVHPIRYDAAHPKPARSVPKEAPPARPSDGGCVHQAGLCTPCKSDTITPGHNLS